MCKAKNMWATSICVLNDDIWVLRGDVCSIWKYNIIENSVEFVSAPKVKDYLNGWLYTSMLAVESKLFLIPYLTDSIAVYDISKKEWLDPIKLTFEGKNGAHIIGAVYWNNNIYCIPEHRPNSVTVVNTNKLEVTTKIDFWSSLPDDAKEINEVKITDNGHIIGIVKYKKIFFVYDISSNNMQIVSEKSENCERWNTIDYSKNQLFINGPGLRRVLVYDLKTLSFLKSIPVSVEKARLTAKAGFLVIDSTATDEFYVLNVTNDKLMSFSIENQENVIFKRDYMTGAVSEYHGKILYHDRKRSTILVIGLDDYEAKVLNINQHETRKMRDELLGKLKNYPFMEFENEIIGLEEFINII